MYAIIEAGGKQFRVQEGNKIVVDRMAAEAGEEVTFDRVLMLGGESAKIGAPVVEGARVVARVIEHFRGEKIRVFKKRRRKGSMRTQGHRQDYTALTVTAINASAARAESGASLPGGRSAGKAAMPLSGGKFEGVLSWLIKKQAAAPATAATAPASGAA